MEEKGFAHILVLLLLIVGLGVAVYLVGQQTNLFSRAYMPKAPKYLSQPVSPTPNPSNAGYYIEKWPSSGIYMIPTSQSDISLQALLKDKATGKVVTNQSGFTYNWRVEDIGGVGGVRVTPYNSCSRSVQAPCPQDHATIIAPKIGGASSFNIWVKVIRNSDKTVLSEVEYVVNLIKKDEFVTFQNVYPNGGETFNVSQKINIQWQTSGRSLSSLPIAYFNVYYNYYKDGNFHSGYVGTTRTNSIAWTVPAELKGQAVRIAIEPRSEVPGTNYAPGMGYSADYFKVLDQVGLTVAKRVFITSSRYSGDLKSAGSKFGLGKAANGLDGADKVCQGSANIAKLGGTWKAWISDSRTSATSRLNHYSGPYQLLDGTMVASKWNYLIDSGPMVPVNLTDFKTAPISSFAWTNTTQQGNAKTTSINCKNWTAGQGKGVRGNVNKIGSAWSSYDEGNCSGKASLYCFEQ